jgi:hypothetical protein
MQCTRCGRGSVIEIRMSLGDSDVTFRRCGRCETQGWSTSEGRVTLNRVLELARVGA